VARASLGELLLDYEDYLRQRKLRKWDKNEPEALAARRIYRTDGADQSDGSDRSDRSKRSDGADQSDESGQADLYRFSELRPEILANTLICLIN
jgi:restriction system protein